MKTFEEYNHNDLISVSVSVVDVRRRSGQRRMYKLQVQTADSQEVPLIVWDGSPAVEVDWQVGRRYRLEDVLFKRWSSDIELNATTQTDAMEIGPSDVGAGNAESGETVQSSNNLSTESLSFIHTTDTYVDRKNMGRRMRQEDMLAAFEEVITTAINVNADGILHTGNVFWSSNPNEDIVDRCRQLLRRLEDENISFALVPGERDATRTRSIIDKMEKEGVLMKLQPGWYSFGSVGLYVHGYGAGREPQLVPEEAKEAVSTYIAAIHDDISTATKYSSLLEFEAALGADLDAVLVGHTTQQIRQSRAGTKILSPGTPERIIGKRNIHEKPSDPVFFQYNITEAGIDIRSHEVKVRPVLGLEVQLSADDTSEDIRCALSDQVPSDAAVVIELTGEQGSDAVSKKEVQHLVEDQCAVARSYDERTNSQSPTNTPNITINTDSRLSEAGTETHASQTAEDRNGDCEDAESGEGDAVGWETEVTVPETVDWLNEESKHSGQIKFTKTVAQQSPETDSIDLMPEVRRAITNLGVEQLYRHQVQALRAVREKQHLILASDTASGKSLPYQVYAVEQALKRGGRTLYIAPMRSLINDQAEGFRELVQGIESGNEVDIAVYNGETSTAERRQIRRQQPQILLMTPELVHQSLLPWHKQHWRWFLRQLETVIIDEVHYFRGVFGSHLGLILRRLNRIAGQYGSSPQYFCCSATISNPKEHGSAITNKSVADFSLVDTDTSGRGTRHWLLYNPPYKTGSDSGGAPSEEYPDNWGTIRRKILARDNYQCTNCGVRGGHYAPVELHAHHIIAVGRGGSHHKSNLITLCAKCHGDQPGHSSVKHASSSVTTPQEVRQERERRSHRPIALQLFVELIDRGHQTLVFTKTRQEAERYAIAATKKCRKFGLSELGDRIQPYHAALPDRTREQIEDGLQSGDIRGVWATSALELGVDIGGLDAVILSGHPGTTMSLFQRAGRAGRDRDDCMILFVASPNPLDQYCISNSEQIFEETPGKAVINPTNSEIFSDHLLSAADESPLTVADEAHFGDQQKNQVIKLDDEGDLTRASENGMTSWQSAVDSPQHNMDLRGISDQEFTLIDQARGTEIGSLQLRDAVKDCHPDAVYSQQKQKYRVEEFNAEQNEVYLTEYDEQEFTQALSEESITVQQKITERDPDTLRNVSVGFAEVTYRSQVNEYLIKSHPEDQNPTREPISQDLPPFELDTEALYITVPDRIRRRAQKMTKIEHPFLCGLHGVEHLLTSLFPLEVLCEQSDIGGLSQTRHDTTGKGTIFIYDTIPGGVGLSQAGFDSVEQLLKRAYKVVINCECEHGCPSCIHSSRCRSGNMALHKGLTTLTLEWMKVPDTRQYI